MSDEKQVINFRYREGNDYRVVPVSGAHGSITPQGLVFANLFFEAGVLPISEAYSVRAENLGDCVKVDKGVSEGPWLDRLVQVGVTMTPDVARNLAEWLVKQANEADKLASRGVE